MAYVTFDPFGLLLVTADDSGQELHVYSLGEWVNLMQSLGLL